MDLKKIKKFIKLAKTEGVESLSYREGEEMISLKLFPDYEQAAQSSLQVREAIDKREESIINVDKNHQVRPGESQGFIEITAPFVGTFYASPAPGEKVFVSQGSRVRKGQTLCILEAMKVMNEIESTESGMIIEVLAENEDFVEYGQVLFKIKKDD